MLTLQMLFSLFQRQLIRMSQEMSHLHPEKEEMVGFIQNNWDSNVSEIAFDILLFITQRYFFLNACVYLHTIMFGGFYEQYSIWFSI